MTQETGKLLVSLTDGIKRVTINRPERLNSVDNETVQLLRDAMLQSATDGTRVVILTGTGESFCAGADLAARGNDAIAGRDVTAAIRENVNPTILAIRNLPVPVIARVHGHAVGLGANLAFACDLIVASEAAQFGQVFVKIGLMPDGGPTWLLPRLLGYHKAFELMATGDIIGAAEAKQLGLVNQVAPLAELDATVDKLASRLARGPRLPIAKMKAGMNQAWQTDLETALDFEAVNQGECANTADFVEGVTAFLEKRKAVFGK